MIDLLTEEIIAQLKRGGATTAELRKITLLGNDYKRAMGAFNEESSTAARRNYIEVEENYQQFAVELTNKYIVGDKKKPEAEFFASRKEAHDWLVANGYAVSIGKFYQDIKKQGFPVVNQDKTVSKYQVRVYADSLVADQQPDPSALARSEHLHRREKAEADLAEMKAERMRREEDAYWLRAEDAWSALAGLIGELRDTIRRQLHDAQVALAQAAGGDVARAPELFEAIDQVVSRAYNDMAGRELNIQWGGEDVDDSAN